MSSSSIFAAAGDVGVFLFEVEDHVDIDFVARLALFLSLLSSLVVMEVKKDDNIVVNVKGNLLLFESLFPMFSTSVALV